MQRKRLERRSIRPILDVFTPYKACRAFPKSIKMKLLLMERLDGALVMVSRVLGRPDDEVVRPCFRQEHLDANATTE